MCNHYRADPIWRERTGDFSHLKIPLRFPEAPANYTPPLHLYPGRDGTVFRLSDDGAALEPAIMRWDLVPFFWSKSLKEKKWSSNNCVGEEMHAKPAFREAVKRRRCLVPIDAIYESCGRGTGLEWEITRTDGRPFVVAGLWDQANTADGPVTSYTAVTTPPASDFAAWHNRQLLMLDAEGAATWLDATLDYAPLLKQPARGDLQAVQVPIRGKGTQAAV